MSYARAADGKPYLSIDGNFTYSTDVTAQQANETGCRALTASAPRRSPVTVFRKGPTFCVNTGGGLALVTEMWPVGSNGVLYLRDLFWG